MTVFSILMTTTLGKVVLVALVAIFLAVFIYDCKNLGFRKAILKTVVNIVLLAVIYLILYYALSKLNAPFALLPLF